MLEKQSALSVDVLGVGVVLDTMEDSILKIAIKRFVSQPEHDGRVARTEYHKDHHDHNDHSDCLCVIGGL